MKKLLLLTFTLGVIMLSSCKKDKTEPIVEQPTIPPITVTSTTINITSKQMCINDNKIDVLKNCSINFWYDKAQSDTSVALFNVITDTLGKYTLIGKEARTYYYRLSGQVKLGSCNKYVTQTGNLIVFKGGITTFNVMIQ